MEPVFGKIFSKFNKQSRVMITIMIMIMYWFDQNTRVHTQIYFQLNVCSKSRMCDSRMW